MSTPETDPQTELLKSIAASLKGIHSSLEHLTGAVEGVAESIEKAHEPEGDLGVHLVGALKDLTSALHKRAQQERSHQPQQGAPRHQQQGRREDRHQQRQPRTDLSDEPASHGVQGTDEGDHPLPSSETNTSTGEPPAEISANPQPKSGRPGGRGRRRGSGRGKPAAGE